MKKVGSFVSKKVGTFEIQVHLKAGAQCIYLGHVQLKVVQDTMLDRGQVAYCIKVGKHSSYNLLALQTLNCRH